MTGAGHADAAGRAERFSLDGERQDPTVLPVPMRANPTR